MDAKAKPQSWIDRLAEDRPDVVLMAPMLVYLVLLGVRNLLPIDLEWVAALIRGAGGLLVVWMFRRHLPPWGRPHVLLALVSGLVIAAFWYYGHLLFLWLGVPHPLPFFGEAEVVDPYDHLQAEHGPIAEAMGVGTVFWLNALSRIAVASTTVGFVEELFWRAFLLRALIDWHNFEKLPLGKFTWFSFLGTSVLSIIEHPAWWAISIPTWFLFNGLMYWKKSVLFLVLAHGFTNLFLYAWVLYVGLALGNDVAWNLW